MRRLITTLAVLALVAMACGDDATDAPQPTGTTTTVAVTAETTPVSSTSTTAPPATSGLVYDAPMPPGAQETTITFDGDTCSSAGTFGWTEGPVAMTLVNNSDLDVALSVRRLFDGVVWDDYVAVAAATDEPPNSVSFGTLFLNRDRRGQEFTGAARDNIYVYEGMYDAYCVVVEGNGSLRVARPLDGAIVVPASDTGTERNSLTVTFDGSECIYDGPTALAEGPVDVTLINEVSDKDVGLDMRRLFGGVAWVDFAGGVSVDLPPPNDITHSVIWLNRDFYGLEWQGELSETVYASVGTHGLMCVVWESGGPPSAVSVVGSEVEVAAAG